MKLTIKNYSSADSKFLKEFYFELENLPKKLADLINKKKIKIILADKFSDIATNETLEEIKKYNKNLNIIGIDCTGFVEIVENRLYEDKNSLELIKSKLALAKDSKRIVLGCTHYPYLVDIFKTILNKDYFNPAICLSKIVKESINQTKKEGSVEFYVSKNPDNFKQSGKMFFDIKNEVKLADI